MNRIECVIIPARGGSKRIKKKNMQPFCGIPMLERSIKLAQKLSDNVIVSSDDDSMLEYAKDLGVYPLLRDKSLADDMVPTLPVIIHAILHLINKDILSKNVSHRNTLDSICQIKDSKTLSDNTEPFGKATQDFINNAQTKNTSKILPHSKVLCLYPTAMFATEAIILESCVLLDKNPNAAYIVPIIEASKTFRTFSLDNEGYFNFLFPKFMNTRSQDLPRAFFDAGQFYLGQAQSFLGQIPLLGEKSIGISMQYAHDIDTMLDLVIAESLFTHTHKGMA